jgi:hypothetical protein
VRNNGRPNVGATIETLSVAAMRVRMRILRIVRPLTGRNLVDF